MFRRRLRQLIERKYRSVDRFWLETEFQRVVGKPRDRERPSPGGSALLVSNERWPAALDGRARLVPTRQNVRERLARDT